MGGATFLIRCKENLTPGSAEWMRLSHPDDYLRSYDERSHGRLRSAQLRYRFCSGPKVIPVFSKMVPVTSQSCVMALFSSASAASSRLRES